MTEGAKVPGLCPQGTQAIPPPGKGREVAGPGVGMLAQATGWGRGGGFAGLDIQNCLPATPGLLAASKKNHLKCFLAATGDAGMVSEHGLITAAAAEMMLSAYRELTLLGTEPSV